MTQKDIILRHLRKAQTISPMTAYGLYGVYRLADVIHKLRLDGYKIRTISQPSVTGRVYTLYKLEA